MSIPDTLLDRFFDALVGEIRESRPAYLQSSFTVAEIYQNLVPYRTHRDIIGAEINGDYEDALLRLLAGEGEFLELESEAARKRIQDELRSSNPNTTIYREFAAAEVRLHRTRARMLAAEAAEGASDAPRAAGRTGSAARVDVGWAPEEATPREETGPREQAVNPDLGLFVSDLFGGEAAGSSEDAPTGTGVSSAPPEGGEGSVAPDQVREGPVGPPAGGQTGEVTSGPPAPPPAPPTPGEAPRPPVLESDPVRAGEPAARWSPPAAPLRGQRSAGGVGLDLEDENRRLRRIVADQALEILHLKDLLDRS